MLAALVLTLGLPWVLWRGPYLLDAPYIDTDTVGDGTGSAALITGLRTALVAYAAALGVGATLVYTARNYRLSRRGQVTERFIKALEHLGSGQIYVRIGGILALEQIVQDAPDQAAHAAQVLHHFLYQHAPADPVPLDDIVGHRRERAQQSAQANGEVAKISGDVQAALTALTRPKSRLHSHQELDFRNLQLPGAELRSADLSAADLMDADLSRANLDRASLSRIYASHAQLARASLEEAVLTRATLVEANLTGASLKGADLTRAMLGGANLRGASLERADLTYAYLRGVNLREANLSRANLTRAALEGAELEGADLREAYGLTAEQLRAAKTDAETKLPPDIEAALRPELP